MSQVIRAYSELAMAGLAARVAQDAHAHREEQMTAAADALWERLSFTGVSWIGFYLFQRHSIPREDGGILGGDLADDGMVLGPCRDKPACSPIGLSGACGRSYLSKRALVVTDVVNLGTNYIACDPRDRSEVVVPCFSDDGTVWGVLDVDSFELESFTAQDAHELSNLLAKWGLSSRVITSDDIDVV